MNDVLIEIGTCLGQTKQSADKSWGALKWQGYQARPKICVKMFPPPPTIIVGSGVRPPLFLFYPHPFYKGTLDTDNSGPPPF